MYKDWENHLRYLVYRFFEVPYDSFDILNLQSEQRKEENIEYKELMKERYIKLLDIIENTDLLSKRQKQVMLLYLGWCNDRFIGHRSISEISRMLEIKQPVIFNYFKMSIIKIQKYLKGENYGKIKRKDRSSQGLFERGK